MNLVELMEATNNKLKKFASDISCNNFSDNLGTIRYKGVNGESRQMIFDLISGHVIVRDTYNNRLSEEAEVIGEYPIKNHLDFINAL